MIQLARGDRDGGWRRGRPNGVTFPAKVATSSSSSEIAPGMSGGASDMLSGRVVSAGDEGSTVAVVVLIGVEFVNPIGPVGPIVAAAATVSAGAAGVLVSSMSSEMAGALLMFVSVGVSTPWTSSPSATHSLSVTAAMLLPLVMSVPSSSVMLMAPLTMTFIAVQPSSAAAVSPAASATSSPGATSGSKHGRGTSLVMTAPVAKHRLPTVPLS